GKENGVNILKSINEGPFQMGTFRETLAGGNEGALHLVSAAGIKVNVAGYNCLKITTARRVSTVRRIKTRERIKMKIVYQDYLRDKYEICL
ncbi:hypothetical protein Tco_0027939, partial [Tanacetum coccineum]